MQKQSTPVSLEKNGQFFSLTYCLKFESQHLLHHFALNPSHTNITQNHTSTLLVLYFSTSTQSLPQYHFQTVKQRFLLLTYLPSPPLHRKKKRKVASGEKRIQKKHGKEKQKRNKNKSKTKRIFSSALMSVLLLPIKLPCVPSKALTLHILPSEQNVC